MASPIEQAIRQICEEKGLAFEAVIETIEAALAAAYRKDFGDKNQNIETEFDSATGRTRVFDVKTVVEDIDLEELERLEEERRAKAEAAAASLEEARAKGEAVAGVAIDTEGEEELPRFNPKTDIMISDAKVLKMSAQVGDVLRTELPEPAEFGRMAAMTAKQVITQKLREAEREIVFNEFKEHEGQVLNGTVQRREGRIVLVDLGRIAGILRQEDQVATERYSPGDRIKVYVRQVSLTTKGPEILLSRTSEELVRKMFEIEIPEVGDGYVKLKAIAREAGSRSKVAVHTDDDNIDPIGACIGQRGTRIQTIIMALGGEKIDIIEWNDNPATFISNALSPAKVLGVELKEDEQTAYVKVDPEQLSLAIGKGGQNVRLAARLSGWRINVDEGGPKKDEAENAAEEKAASAAPEAELSKTEEAPAPEEAAPAVVESAPAEDKPAEGQAGIL